MSSNSPAKLSRSAADIAEILNKSAESYKFCFDSCVSSDSESVGNSRGGIFEKVSPRRIPAIIDRFWAKVNKNDPSGCWLWTASCWSFGHGQFTIRRWDGKQIHPCAHRVAWELANGPIPDGLQANHRCNVPQCVNPDHLYLGTQQENLDDARRCGNLIDGLGARKLSDEAYREILATPIIRGSGNGKALARKFGVSKITISRIRHGKTGSTFHRQQPAQPVAPEPQQPLSAQDALSRMFERVPHVVIPSFRLGGEVR